MTRPASAAIDWMTVGDIGGKVGSTAFRGKYPVTCGITRRSATGRITRMRPIRSIARDVKLNGQIWDLATEVLAG
jgi:hypothetical protein